MTSPRPVLKHIGKRHEPEAKDKKAQYRQGHENSKADPVRRGGIDALQIGYLHGKVTRHQTHGQEQYAELREKSCILV